MPLESMSAWPKRDCKDLQQVLQEPFAVGIAIRLFQSGWLVSVSSQSFHDMRRMERMVSRVFWSVLVAVTVIGRAMSGWMVLWRSAPSMRRRQSPVVWCQESDIGLWISKDILQVVRGARNVKKPSESVQWQGVRRTMRRRATRRRAMRRWTSRTVMQRIV
jgi:hypothetical protein